MSTQHHVGRISGGLPFDIDLLEQDLELKFPGFANGRPIAWGLAVAAVAGTWTEVVRIAGLDWTAEFYPPKEFKVPKPRRSPKGRLLWSKIPTHCVLLTVRTDRRDINGARDSGRPAVRSLLALLRREVPVLLPSQVVWEGALMQLRRGRLRMTTAAMELESAKPITGTRIHRMGLKLAKVSLLSMPAQLRQALEWLNLARSASVRAEKFMHLWLAILTLASFGRPRRWRDLRRVIEYTKTMGHGVGGVLSPLSIADLNDRLRRVYRIRNDLLHRSDDSKITLDSLDALERDAFALVDFELAKLGTPLPAT